MNLRSAILQLIVDLPMVFCAYWALRKAMLKDKQEIKDHNEVSVKQANGSFGYSVRAMPMPVYVKTYSEGENGRPRFLFQHVNKHYADLFGLRAEEMEGKSSLSAGIPKSIADETFAKDVEVWSTGKPAVFIKNMPNGDQRKFYKAPYFNDDGKVIGVQGYEIGAFCKNITQD